MRWAIALYEFCVEPLNLLGDAIRVPLVVVTYAAVVIIGNNQKHTTHSIISIKCVLNLLRCVVTVEAQHEDTAAATIHACCTPSLERA